MNKTSLLEKVKESNIPRRNCMKTEEELEEAIKDIITKYKEIIFDPEIPICMACWNPLRIDFIAFVDHKITCFEFITIQII